MSKLSDVFKYISFYRSAGHQIGRKVGDMLEVLTYGALHYDQNLKKRLHIEPNLYGFSDAGHKVEFLITKDVNENLLKGCLLYTSPSPRDRTRSRMPSSA